MGGERQRSRTKGRDRRRRQGNDSLPPVALSFPAKLRLLLTALLLPGLLASCDTKPEAPEPVEDQSEAAQEAALDTESPAIQFLPRGEALSGWSLIGDPEVYPAARLENWFAGEADEHRAYRIVDATVARYESNAGDAAIIELLRFPDFVQAFGAWSSSRPARAEPINLENRSYRLRNSIHIWRGPFYVRVTGAKADPAAETARAREIEQRASSSQDEEADEPEESPDGEADAISVEELARTTASSIPVAPGLPAVMRFLPTTDRVAGSERYLASSGLGHPFLANSFLVDYMKGTGEDPVKVTGLILPSPSRETAERILEALRAFYERNGRVLDQVPNLGEGNFTGEDEYSGRLIALRIDRFVVAFSGFADVATLRQMAISTDERIIAAIREALTQAERSARDRARSNR